MKAQWQKGNEKAYYRQYSAERRQSFKALGICPRCGQEDAYEGGICLQCRERIRETRRKTNYNEQARKYTKERYARRKARGKCVKCGVRDQEYGLICGICREKRKEKGLLAMLKSELITKVQEKASLKSKAQAEDAVNAVIDLLKDDLMQGGQTTFVGFGTFKLVERAARKGRNPQTGEAIDLPACKTVRFTPSRALKEAVAG